MESAAFTYDYVCLSPDCQIGQHSQTAWELAYVICGAGSRTIGNRTVPITEGEVVLIPPLIPHVWDFDPSVTDTAGNIANIAVTFEQSVLDVIEMHFPEAHQSVSRLKSLTIAIAYTGETRQRIGRLLLSMRGLSPEARLPLMFELIALMADTDGCSPAGSNRRLSKAEQRLEKIRVFCACNYARDIRLDEAAAHAGMNKSAFCTFMRHHNGKSFSEYVNCYRLEKAAERLTRTDNSIAEIAYDVGFANVTYFNRLFKSQFGHTPGTIRKKR